MPARDRMKGLVGVRPLNGMDASRGRSVGALDDMVGALSAGSAQRRICPDVAMACVGHVLRGGEPVSPDAPPGTRFVHTIAADVRLDNRAELAGALGIPGGRRAGMPDGELVRLAYGRWGCGCPLKLVGDYAFAIWDGTRRRLFCARDAAGARPFYFSRLPDLFVFSSAVDAVLAVPGVDRALDDAFVAAYLLRCHPGGERTFFRGVRRLPPGHCLTVEAGGGQALRRWWRPEDVQLRPPASDDDLAAEFLDLYLRAVRDRLHDARSPGVHVSGGLDSSSVAVLAARELGRSGRTPQAFCWQPPPSHPRSGEAAEYDLIEAVCRQEGLRPVYCASSPALVAAALRRDGARMPDRDGTLLLEAQVQRNAAERGVDVVLSGWGGDEAASFSGTGHLTDLACAGNVGLLLRVAREESPRPLRHLLVALLPLLHPGLPNAARRIRTGRVRRRHIFVHPSLRRLAQAACRRPRTVGGWSTRLARVDDGGLAERMEDWAASGARRGIEYRYPLLDRRLVEFALGLPPTQFRRGRTNRWLMRHALRDVLPEDVRCNADKTDPARTAGSRAALAGALPLVRRELAARAEPPARARYLDMPRLLASIERSGVDGLAQPGKLQAALQFLDW